MLGQPFVNAGAMLPFSLERDMGEWREYHGRCYCGVILP